MTCPRLQLFCWDDPERNARIWSPMFAQGCLSSCGVYPHLQCDGLCSLQHSLLTFRPLTLNEHCSCLACPSDACILAAFDSFCIFMFTCLSSAVFAALSRPWCTCCDACLVSIVICLQVMQVYPTELAGRRQLHDYQLNAGKATMVSQGNVACQYETDISLLDVFDLPISTT